MLFDQVVEPVLGCRGTGFGASRGDAALRGHHGFVAEQFHQGVDGDVRVGQLGGEGVAQSMHECAAARSASMPARRNARSTRYCRVPRVMRSPLAPTNRAVGGQAASPPAGEERR